MRHHLTVVAAGHGTESAPQRDPLKNETRIFALGCKKPRRSLGFLAIYLFRYIILARPTGFEPVTYRFVAGHSIR